MFAQITLCRPPGASPLRLYNNTHQTRRSGTPLFRYMSTHGIQASTALSDVALAPVLESELLEDHSLPTQRELCHKRFMEQRDALTDTLAFPERTQLIESASVLGRKWLDIIPFNNSLRLSDFKLSPTLQVRKMIPETNGVLLWHLLGRVEHLTPWSAQRTRHCPNSTVPCSVRAAKWASNRPLQVPGHPIHARTLSSTPRSLANP